MSGLLCSHHARSHTKFPTGPHSSAADAAAVDLDRVEDHSGPVTWRYSDLHVGAPLLPSCPLTHEIPDRASFICCRCSSSRSGSCGRSFRTSDMALFRSACRGSFAPIMPAHTRNSRQGLIHLLQMQQQSIWIVWKIIQDQ